MRLLLLLAACALASALVPRDRRAVNTEEDEEHLRKQEPLINYCAPKTPCKWGIYSNTRHEVDDIVNGYCICGKGELCMYVETDTNTLAYVYRCRDPTSTYPIPEETTMENS